MPGKDGRTEGSSENRTAFADPGRQPAVEQVLTLGTTNDIGSSVRYQKTPAILKGITHYALGTVPSSYVTTAMDSTAPPPPPAGRAALPPAGQVPPPGPSDVEQGFGSQFTSRHINIITGGPRLHGGYNSDAMLHS